MNVKINIVKTFTFTVILTLLLAAAGESTPSAVSGEAVSSDTFTHRVFAEFGTATW